MIEYKELNHFEWASLKDEERIGYFKIFYNPECFYYKNNDFHNEYGPAYTEYYNEYMIGEDIEEYYLYDKYFGNQNDFTKESWAKFAAKYIKLRAFE